MSRKLFLFMAAQKKISEVYLRPECVNHTYNFRYLVYFFLQNVLGSLSIKKMVAIFFQIQNCTRSSFLKKNNNNHHVREWLHMIYLNKDPAYGLDISFVGTSLQI